MKFEDFLNELTLKKDQRMELRDEIINALVPGGTKLGKAIKQQKGDTITLSRRDAQILMDGISRVGKFLTKIKVEK